MQVETEDGGVYYYHSVTRVSRWDRPNEEVAAALEARILQANSQVDEAVQVSFLFLLCLVRRDALDNCRFASETQGGVEAREAAARRARRAGRPAEGTQSTLHIEM